MRQNFIFPFILVMLVCSRAHAGEHDFSVRAGQQKDAQAGLSATRETVRHSLRSLNAQTELPAPKRARIPEPVGSPPAIPLEMAQVMLWVALAILAAIIVFTIVDNLRPPTESVTQKEKKRASEELHAVHTRMGMAQDAADMLAAGGNFTEAIHTLLLQSLDEMRRRLGIPIAISLTSREVLARVALSHEAKGALSDIINRVEISYFGDHAPGAEEYRLCRHSYSTLANLLRGGDGRG